MSNWTMWVSLETIFVIKKYRKHLARVISVATRFLHLLEDHSFLSINLELGESLILSYSQRVSSIGTIKKHVRI